MERSGRSLVLLVIALLCSGHLVLGSHFRGGTISWEYIGGKKVHFDYMVGWRRNSGEGGGCNEQDVTSQKVLIGSGKWGCVQGCNSQESLKYRCIGYNKPSNWMVGSGTFEMNMPSVQASVVEYTGCCFITSSVMTQTKIHTYSGASWRLRTTIDISIRQDIGKPNSSPVTTSKPLIKVKSGCPSSIPLAVSDPDGDDVRCRMAVGQECGQVCGIVPYGSLDETTCILTFYPPHDVDGLWVLALTLEDFATVNGQTTGPFSSIPLQVILEFQPNAICASPKFVKPTPNNNDKFNITSGQPFSFDIDIESSSPSESIVSLTTISSEPTTQQNITRDTSSVRLFHTGLSLTSQANSHGEKQICFFATESSGQETELRCIIVTIIQDCVPISYSYSPKDLKADIITWSIAFNKQLPLNSTSGFIRFWDTRSSRMIVKVAASSADIQADLMTLTFRLSRRALPSGQPVYITVDDGVAESTDGLTCKGYNFTDHPFTIPRTAYAECHASGDPHFKFFKTTISHPMAPERCSWPHTARPTNNVPGRFSYTWKPNPIPLFLLPPELTSWFTARSSVSSIIRALRLIKFLLSCHITIQVGTSTSYLKIILFLCCTPRIISPSNITAGDACRSSWRVRNFIMDRCADYVGVMTEPKEETRDFQTAL